MRPLNVACLVSLDGVVESPGAWSSPFFDEECEAYALAKLNDADTFLLGRVAYQELAGKWSQIRGSTYFDRINALPKLIASRTLRKVDWNGSIIQGDVGTALAKEKNRPGKKIIKYGVSQLDRTLLAHHLVDEYNIWIMPTRVGAGKRIFADVESDQLKLELTSTHRFRNGVVVLNYTPTLSDVRPDRVAAQNETPKVARKLVGRV